jgi:glutamate-1-semialdehyde 2,1-aminomutase
VKTQLDIKGIDVAASDVLVRGSQQWLRTFGYGDVPLFIKEAKGPYVWNTQNTKLVDFFLGSGAVILGHCDPQQTQAVYETMLRMPTVCLRSPLEVEVARLLQELIPLAERTVFFKTGSECAHMAVRIAQKLTGRMGVLSVGYHGWLPPFFRADNRADKDSTVTEFAAVNDNVIVELCERGQKIAALIVSPSPYTTTKSALLKLRASCAENGCLFIMDEIKSGFRWKYPTVSSVYGIEPDLLLLAKGMSNGFPLAAMVGPESILGGMFDLGHFSTFAGESVSLSAARACLRSLAAGAYQEFESASTLFRDCLATSLEGAGVAVEGEPTFFRLRLPDTVESSLLAGALVRRGVLFHPEDEVLLSAAHNDPVLLDQCADAFFESVNAVLGRHG